MDHTLYQRAENMINFALVGQDRDDIFKFAKK